MINLKNIVTTDQAEWGRHDQYRSAEQAEIMAEFFKNQIGYSAVKVVEDRQEHVASWIVYVLNIQKETV